MASEIGEEEFQRRVHYRKTWGFPWPHYKALLDFARAKGMPVHAMNHTPTADARVRINRPISLLLC
jgi:uncharacterized iron-regulated protein